MTDKISHKGATRFQQRCESADLAAAYKTDRKIKVRRESEITEKVNHRSVDLKEAASIMSLKKHRERKFSEIQGPAANSVKPKRVFEKPPKIEEVNKPTYGFQIKNALIGLMEKAAANTKD